MFIQHGAKLAFIVGIEDLEYLNAIQAAGGKAISIKCDVTKTTDVQAMVEQRGVCSWPVGLTDIEGE